MSEVVVRAARPEEFTEVGELTVTAYAADSLLDHGDDYAAQLRATADRAEHAELLVAVDGTGALLGTVTVAFPGGRYAQIAHDGELEFRMLAVAPHARGRGVGEALTRAVLDRAHELGATRVVLCTLEAMKAAHRLYERLGFTRSSDRDWEPLPGLLLLGFGLDLTRPS